MTRCAWWPQTVIAWHAETGKPVGKAIVWQCRRTADYCNRLKAEGFDKVIKEKTGLVTDAVPAAVQALDFRDDRNDVIMRYGAAMAFDANGDTTPVTTAFAKGEITLTVPGAWLASAQLPVVVDPLLTRVLVSTAGGIQSMVGQVDIAEDHQDPAVRKLVRCPPMAAELLGRLVVADQLAIAVAVPLLARRTSVLHCRRDLHFFRHLDARLGFLQE